MSAAAGGLKTIRVAVVGTGEFGRNHARVYRELEGVELVGVFDENEERAAAVAAEYQTQVLKGLDELRERADAASVAVPTVAHAEVGCRLLEMGLDVLVEKPMAVTLAEADALVHAAKKNARILQVGHVERFNPAVVAVEPILNRPLFFEVHRLGVFTPRSLDVDVIYDLMIHDLDVLLALVGETGGGKSTVAKLLCRFYEPTGGSIRIDGVDYRKRSLHWLQSSLGIVLQEPHLFSGTIRENIRYGRLNATDAEIEAVAAQVGVSKFIAGFPDGYATEVGEGGNRLSTGQKQLVALRQRYDGHAKRAALVAAAHSYMARIVVVVDDDIDPSNLADVMWAVTTRCEPAEQIDIVRNAWSSALDPRIPPPDKARGVTSHSKVIIEACRPFAWMDQFPPTSALSQDEMRVIEEKWGGVLKGTK